LHARQTNLGAGASRSGFNHNGIASNNGGGIGFKGIHSGMHAQATGKIQRGQHPQPESVFAGLGGLIPAGFGNKNQGLQVGNAAKRTRTKRPDGRFG